MTIQPADSFGAINTAVTGLLTAHPGALPAPVVAAVMDNLRSPVDRVVDIAEGLYAVACAATDTGVKADVAAACGAAVLFVVANRFHALGQTDRGLKMANACRRRAGESVDQPASDDPAPAAGWLG